MNNNETPQLTTIHFKRARLYSIISTVIHQCGIRAIFPLGVLSVYVFSYFVNTNKLSEKQFNLTVFPVSLFTFTMTITIPIAGILEQIIGQRFTITLSNLIMLLGLAILYFCESPYFALFNYIILGFGLGLSSMLTIKSSTYYFPENAGLMTALINSSGSLFVAGYNLIGDFFLINPQQIQPEEGSGVYKDLKGKTYTRYIIMASFFLVVFLIPTLIFFTISLYYKQKYETGMKLIQSDDNVTQKLYKDENECTTNEENDSEKEIIDKTKRHSKELFKKNLKRIFTTFPIYRLSIECFLTAFLPLLIYNTYKPVSLQNGRHTSVLAVTTSIAAIALACANPIWGYLYDKKSFRPLLLAMGIGGIINGFFFLLAIHSDYLITLAVICNNSLLGAAQTIFFPHVVKIFGLVHSMIVSGVIGLAIGMVSLFSCIFGYIIKNIYGEDVTAYYVMYGVGIALTACSLYFSWTDKEEKFDYGEEGMYEEVDDNVEGMKKWKEERKEEDM